MARQNRYANDTSIQGADRLTGIRSENGATANFTLEDIANYLATTGNADGSRLGIKYNYKGEYTSTTALTKGDLYVEHVNNTPDNNKGYSTIKYIYFNNTSQDNQSITPLSSLLENGIIKLTNTSTPGSRAYGLYRVTGAPEGVPGNTNSATFLTLSYISSEGSLGNTGSLTLSPFQVTNLEFPADYNGTVIRYGTAAPENNVTANQGSFYIQIEVREGVETPIRFYGPKEGDDNTGWGTGTFFQGEQGLPGERGLPGPPGPAAGFGSITVTTGAPGSLASVTTSGEDTAKNFAFEIPRGDKGEDGDPGGVGPAAGFGTITVNTGAAGSEASVVESGPNTAKNLTFTIPRGNTGLTGPDGDSAYQIAVADGFSGTEAEWLASLVGARGADGRTILHGTGSPSDSTDGNNGDFFIDTVGNNIYGPKSGGLWGAARSLRGETGDRGPIGPDGADGASVLNGTTDPTDTAPSDAANGDFYINTTTSEIWGPYSDASSPFWGSSGTSLEGDAGNSVLNGTVDPVAADGNDGDFFINTSTNEIFGPRVGGAWPATGTSLVGPAGSGTQEIEWDDTSIATGVDTINFEGSGVTSVTDDGSGKVTVVIAGGGAGAPAEISELSSFTQTGFVANTFRTTDQAITFSVAWTPVSGTAPVSLAITNNGGLTNPTTITTVATLDGTVTFPAHTITATLPAGNVRWTATLTYTDGDGTSRTISRNLDLELDKTLPTLTFGTPSFTGFHFATPMVSNSQQEIEANDAGNIVYAAPTQVDAGWTRTTTDPTFLVSGTDASLTAPSTLTVTAGDRGDNVSITGTQEYDAVGTEDATATDTENWNRIVSFRYGSVASASAPIWTATGASTDFDMHNFTAFEGTRRTIDFGNQAPNTTVTITSNAGEWIYFVFSNAFTPTSISTNSPSVNYLNHVGTDPDAAFIRRNTVGTDYVVYTLLRETLYDGTSLTFNIN